MRVLIAGNARSLVIRLALVLIPALLLSISVSGQTLRTAGAGIPRVEERKEFLKGLTGFDVAVRVEHPDSSAIRTAIELKLRQNGILVSRGQSPLFAFECDLLNATGFEGVTIWGCDLEIYLQAVRRGPTLMTGYMGVWTSSGLGKVGITNLGKILLEQANERTDRFLNDWYEMNPKR